MPEDFAKVFPDLEFITYSSWSHTPSAPRYRICIPSTQLIPSEVHALILHTIVDRLEAAGWADALADGKKHGVDIGKLHEAAMFYLPSKRPDCFLTHVHEREVAHAAHGPLGMPMCVGHGDARAALATGPAPS